MPRVTILGAGADGAPVAVDCAEGTTLFEAGAKVAAGIETSCVGKGTCGLCRVKIVAGGEHLSPYTEEEIKHLGNVYFITKVRLSCRSRIAGDVTIEVARKKRA